MSNKTKVMLINLLYTIGEMLVSYIAIPYMLVYLLSAIGVFGAVPPTYTHLLLIAITFRAGLEYVVGVIADAWFGKKHNREK